MNPYIAKLNDHFIVKNQTEPASVLTFLSECYLESNPVKSEPIRQLESELEPFFDALPIDISNRIFGLLYSLCYQYESAAFSAGLQTGIRLSFEIDPPPTQTK